MKKKYLNLFIIVALAFFVNIINANAAVPNCSADHCSLPSEDFKDSTYVIGKYVFSTERDTDMEETVFTQTLETREYNGVLTGQHIMLAASSIEGEYSWSPIDLSDMKIIEKSGNIWIDPFTGEQVETPEIITFKYYDMLPVGNVTINEEIDTPILTKTSAGSGTFDSREINESDENIELEYETSDHIQFTITSVENADYYELAVSYSEKGIYKLESTSIDEYLYGYFKEGETKYYKARACNIGNQSGDECGQWSNIVLFNDELGEPDFTNLSMGYNEETSILTLILKVGLENTAIDGVEIFSSKEQYNIASYKLFKDLKIENEVKYIKVNSAYDETQTEITIEQIYEQNLTRCYDETESYPCYYGEYIQTGGDFDLNLETGEYGYYRARSYKVINGRKVYSPFTKSELFSNEIVDLTVAPTISFEGADEVGNTLLSISQVENASEYYIYVTNRNGDLAKFNKGISIHAEDFENGKYSFSIYDLNAVRLLYGDPADRMDTYGIDFDYAPFSVYAVARIGDIDDPYTLSAPSNVYKQGIEDVPEISVVDHTGEEGYLTDVDGISYYIDEDGKYNYEFKINASDFVIEGTDPVEYDYDGYYIVLKAEENHYTKLDMNDSYTVALYPGETYTFKAYLYKDSDGSISNPATINIDTTSIN